MDQLNDAPIHVKALVVALLCGLVFVLFQMVLIDDVQGQIDNSNRTAQKATKDAQKLQKQYGDPAKLEEMKQARDRLKARLEQIKSRLPSEDKIANLFESLAEQAVKFGLELGERTKLPHEYGNYVKRVPISMSVTGTFPAVINYFRSLKLAGEAAGNEDDRKQRLTTLSSLQLTARPFGDAMPELPKFNTRTTSKMDSKTIKLNDDRRLIARLDAYEEGRSRATVKAEFVVTAYTYTGKVAPASKKKRRRARRRRR